MRKEVFKQSKGRFNDFLNLIKDDFELIAPVKKDVSRFEPIKDIKDIYLEKNSYFPAKEYFFKKEEVLFQFDGKGFFQPHLQHKSRVFFGMRRCDLNAIHHQDIAFKGVNDPYYFEARKNTFLLGYHCNEAPSEYCFCGSLDLIDFFDLMFFDKGKHFLVEVGSEKGDYLIKKYSKYFTKTSKKISEKEKIIPGADRLENKDLSKLYDNPGWKKGVDICLSCSVCTSLCPTCYCFEIHDEVKSSDLSTGERKRKWSSCQLPEFTKVAGDHVFRKEREERFKHRIYHQLDYFKEKNGINLCVGCGRCIEGCPTRIDFVQIINEMGDENAKNNPVQ